MDQALNNLNIFNQMSVRIIKRQESIIGPLAWDEAKKVHGLDIIDAKKGEVVVNGEDKKEILNRLIAQYERLFGKISHEVCRESVKDLIKDLPPEEVPSSLK